LQVKLLDILACPICEFFPVELIPINKKADEIDEAVLVCNNCRHWFPVINGIPHLIRDGMRKNEDDLKFLSANKDNLPDRVKFNYLPNNLSGKSHTHSEDDLLILSEGAYWSEYTKANYAVGNTSFLDIRSRSTHPSFYFLGVLERDDKDKNRECGMWPDHLAKHIFGFLEKLEPGWALDVGCGGGQFGLEAAYQGWNLASIDVALGSLEVAKDYSRKISIPVNYIYAEPHNPPFRKKVFDLLMAKDSLHHLDNLDEVLNKIHSMLRYDGKCLFFEHVGQSKIKDFIKNRANRYLHPKIQRRYPRVDIPEVMKNEAPCEDLGCADILPLMDKYFHIRKKVMELMLYHELEFSIYYAFGKRMWFSGFVTWFIRWFIEKPLLLVENPEFAILIGDKRN
jgi:uncharacterized protein YbaR (Trm112 family)/SAM-dependent methyltransferase